ncbi:MAG: tRNA glutamyl-Q(34) synthetase GluQRS [Halieaceae bacterium]
MTKSRKSRSTAEPNSSPATSYIGRFAPSPTGPLHLGSLICALASYLDARQQGGLWLMRMEDLDPPREEAGAAQRILDSLSAHGLDWDGPTLWQSQRLEAYADTVQELLDQQLAFRCDCSRARLLGQENIYRGRCRSRQIANSTAAAVRVIVSDDSVIELVDRLQAPLTQNLAEELGDFIVRRKDQLFAYQLAVVLDDAYQGVTQVLRGSDLYDSTPRQIYLQRLLGLPTPGYAHIPVITNNAGQKLSKQTHAPALDDNKALANLKLALRFLGQPAPSAECQQVDQLLVEAVANWQLQAVPAVPGIPETALY